MIRLRMPWLGAVALLWVVSSSCKSDDGEVVGGTEDTTSGSSTSTVAPDTGSESTGSTPVSTTGETTGRRYGLDRMWRAALLGRAPVRTRGHRGPRARHDQRVVLPVEAGGLR